MEKNVKKDLLIGMVVVAAYAVAGTCLDRKSVV